MFKSIIRRLTEEEKRDIDHRLNILLIIMTYATDPKVREAALHAFLILLDKLKNSAGKEAVKGIIKYGAPALKTVISTGIKFII